jgi:hypothetical protein
MKIIGLNQNIIWKNIYANFSLIERKFENEADLFFFQRCLQRVFA